MNIPIDKRKHIMAGIVIFAMTIAMALSIQIKMTTPLYLLSPVWAAAIGKEAHDYLTPNHTAEVADFVATVAVPTMITVVMHVYWG